MYPAKQCHSGVAKALLCFGSRGKHPTDAFNASAEGSKVRCSVAAHGENCNSIITVSKPSHRYPLLGSTYAQMECNLAGPSVATSCHEDPIDH
jgi:hypothetical protein